VYNGRKIPKCLKTDINHVFAKYGAGNVVLFMEI
jgi:hypothetical protein